MTPIDDHTSTPRGSWEDRLADAARRFEYPPTPAIARAVRARLDAAPPARRPTIGGWARAALIALVALAALLSVPGVRAAVLDFIRVGAVKIFVAPTATPTPIGGTGGQIPLTATPTGQFPAPTLSLDELSGETTLDDARAAAGFPVMLPAYPADLGPPDRVYLQNLGGNVVIMVWMDRDQPGRVGMSLHALGPGTNAFKTGARLVRELVINGQYAAWLEGPYMLVFRDGQADMRRMIDGHVLVWTAGDVTYRLETDLSLDEAVKTANSLK